METTGCKKLDQLRDIADRNGWIVDTLDINVEGCSAAVMAMFTFMDEPDGLVAAMSFGKAAETGRWSALIMDGMTADYRFAVGATINGRETKMHYWKLVRSASYWLERPDQLIETAHEWPLEPARNEWSGVLDRMS